MSKQRQERILEWIESREIETQEELCNLLNQEGFDVSQATVSRDIRKLNLTKAPNEAGKMCYTRAISREDDFEGKYGTILKNGFVSAESAQNILVVKTISGMAMAVAAAIDAMHWDEVVGCIAGDDTVMCVLRTSQDASHFKTRLLGLGEE